jgi:hypothetical protein
MDITIQTSRRIRELISNGVITVGVHITRDGNEIWARAVQPHPRLGITTHQSYTLDEIESSLAKVKTDLPARTDIFSPDLHPARVLARAGEGYYGFADVAAAISYARDHLRDIKRGSLRNKLPLDSLCKDDLEMKPKDLFARTALVGHHLTTAKLVARIASQRDKLSVKGASTLNEWWSDATAVQRLMLVMRSKHLPKQEDGLVRLHGHWLDKLSTMAFPFRDAEAAVGQEEDEVSAEEGDSSADDLATETQGISLSGW